MMLLTIAWSVQTIFYAFFQISSPTFQYNYNLIFHPLVGKGMVQVLKCHIQGYQPIIPPTTHKLTFGIVMHHFHDILALQCGNYNPEPFHNLIHYMTLHP